MRIVQIADDAEVFARAGGPAAALRCSPTGAAPSSIPNMVDLVTEQVLGGLDGMDAWTTVIDGCAALDRRIGEDELDDVLAIFADYADLKSPWFLGHSRAVAGLARAAAGQRTGRSRTWPWSVEPDSSIVSARPASRPGSGTSRAAQRHRRERVRQVPYLTERSCAANRGWPSIGAVAGDGHERMDGSGYPRGLAGAALPAPPGCSPLRTSIRRWPRTAPGRAALPPDERRGPLLAEVRAGRLDQARSSTGAGRPDTGCAGGRTLVAGLTAREAEVLALLVRGCRTGRSPSGWSSRRAPSGHHVEHIYAKTGVTTRGAAVMFALRHGLVDAGDENIRRSPDVTGPAPP